MPLQNHVKLILIVLPVVALIWLLLLATQIQTSFNHLKSLDFQKATESAQTSLLLLKPISSISLSQIAEVETLKETMEVITQLPDPITITNLPTFAQTVDTIEKHTHKIEQQCQKSLLHKFRLVSGCQFAGSGNQVIEDLSLVVNSLLEGKQHYIILLQNNHELRATGGFIGSYADVLIADGELEEFAIHDIYEPDGQFTGFFEAPPGVKEYLSSGQGLRLPDANWYPDFATSSQQILRYFALGKKTDIDGVVAINLSVVEDILGVTGGIFIPDYGVTVTQNNIAALARADRDQFFPGSYQKPNFLNAVLTQLQLKLENLNLEQKRNIITIALRSVESKNIQFYSNNTQVQELLSKYRLAGQITPPTSTKESLLSHLFQPINLISHDSQNTSMSNPRILYLIESNVGINKANKKISRDIKIDVSDYRTKIIIDFSNNNKIEQLTTDENLHYINYQRILTDLDYKLEKISINGQPIDQWDQSIIEDNNKNQFQQIGFLTSTSQEEITQVTIEFSHPQLVFPTYLWIPKQPGLPSTPYQIWYQDQEVPFLLEKDTLISVEKLDQ